MSQATLHLSVLKWQHLILNPWRNVEELVTSVTFLYKVLHEHVTVSPDHLDLILAGHLPVQSPS